MLNWTRALSISAISVTVAMSMSASAQTAGAPLFSFFKTFCVDTRADWAAIKKAVEAAGIEVRKLPDTETPETWSETWEKGTDGNKITLMASSEDIQPNRTIPNERNVSSCVVADNSHDFAGAEAVRRWVGVPPSATPVDRAGNGTEMYEYTYQEVAGTRSAVPADRFYDTDDVWKLLVVDSARWGTISVFMSHNTIPRQMFWRIAPTSN